MGAYFETSIPGIRGAQDGSSFGFRGVLSRTCLGDAVTVASTLS